MGDGDITRNWLGSFMMIISVATIAFACYVLKILSVNDNLRKMKIMMILVIIHEVAIFFQAINWINNFKFISQYENGVPNPGFFQYLIVFSLNFCVFGTLLLMLNELTVTYM